eukprot:4781044-Prymnesium_polylepis.1
MTCASPPASAGAYLPRQRRGRRSTTARSSAARAGPRARASASAPRSSAYTSSCCAPAMPESAAACRSLRWPRRAPPPLAAAAR